MGTTPDYDLRYLAGIVLFNRQDFFAAHEVWEDLWHEAPAADRRFHQSLIQAAVALYHWGRGNGAGARRLFHSGREYMAPYGPRHLGLDATAFWDGVRTALAGALADSHRLPGPDRPPIIALDPPPLEWPGDAVIARLLGPREDGT
jgi:predicted metal-dependent hydrolase